MKNFIIIKNEKERKIFLDYCKKHNVVLASGTKVEKEISFFSEPGFQIFFNSEHFNYLTFIRSTTYAQKKGEHYYNEVKFNDFFKIKNVLEIE